MTFSLVGGEYRNRVAAEVPKQGIPEPETVYVIWETFKAIRKHLPVQPEHF